MYGYQDSKELSGGKFGLNTGFVTKFEFNANAGQAESPGEALDLTIEQDGKKYMKRIFPIGKIYGPEGNELTDASTEEYKKAFSKEVKLLNATVVDIVRCFVPEEAIKTALATPIANFKDYCEILQRLVHSVPNFNTQPVDFFLQYQWLPKGDNKVAFLELPKNVKHGSFICKSKGVDFKVVEGIEGLKYSNVAGATHLFKRSGWFIESAFAVQAKIETPTSDTNTSLGKASQETSW